MASPPSRRERSEPPRPTDRDPSEVTRLDGQLLSDLWVFRAAARFGSLTAAAQRLGVSQGAVSQRILRMESRLGAPLFLRRKGRISLTEEGRSIFDAMTRVSLVLNDSLGRIERLHRTALVVSCVPSLATEWLVPRLQEFYERHPGIEIFVRAELAPSTPERLEAERVDLVLDYRPDAPADLHQLGELREWIIPVCSPRYRDGLAASPPLAPTLLHDDLACLGLPAEFEWNSWRDAQRRPWPHAPGPGRHFNLAHLAYHAAMGDQGVAIGRALLLHRLLNRGELVRAIDVPPVPGSVYRILAGRPGAANSAVRVFAAWCLQAMSATQAASLALLAPTGSAADLIDRLERR